MNKQGKELDKRDLKSSIPKEIGKGGRYRILEYLLSNVGKAVSTKELQKVSGYQGQYGRRLRELRDEFGYSIKSNNDDASIPAGYYKLDSPNPTSRSHKRSISGRTRMQVLHRDGYTCQACGATAGTPHHVTGKKTVLHVSHIRDKSMGGSDELDNLRVFCSVCNQGAKNITPDPTPEIKLVTLVRQGSEKTQIAVLKWLAQKFSVYDLIKEDLEVKKTLYSGKPRRTN